MKESFHASRISSAAKNTFTMATSDMKSPLAQALQGHWEVVNEEGAEKTNTHLLRGKYLVCRTTDKYRSFAEGLQAKNLVIEIGCANGFCTKRILSRCLQENYLGLDVSSSFIRECREKFPGVAFVKSDVLFDWKSVELLGQKFVKDRTQVSEVDLDIVVFIDIGGNRELESIVALIPAVVEAWSPHAVVIKSETLHEYGIANGLDDRSWARLMECSKQALLKRRPCQPSSKREYHPLRMPTRLNQDGVVICRYHNYDEEKGCLRYRDTNNYGNTCEFDHETCHSCLKIGHRAFECPQKDDPLIESLVKFSPNTKERAS